MYDIYIRLWIYIEYTTLKYMFSSPSQGETQVSCLPPPLCEIYKPPASLIDIFTNCASII